MRTEVVLIRSNFFSEHLPPPEDLWDSQGVFFVYSLGKNVDNKQFLDKHKILI